MTDDTRQNYQLQLTEIEAFMKTRAFSSYKTTIHVDIEGTRNSILAMPPETPENISHSLKLYGKLDLLHANLTFFEDACDDLKKKLSEIDELTRNVT